MSDKDNRQCKVCKVLKVRILSGRFDAANKRYTDESLRYWNGSVCPECNNKRVKERMRSKRDG